MNVMDKITCNVGHLDELEANREYVKQHGCYVNTINGECSKCGQCCGNIIPLSTKEIKRIKNLIRVKKIKPHRLPAVCMSIDLTCPFLNLDTNLCNIYNARPYICKVFKCDKKPTIKDYFNAPGELIPTNMWEFFN